MKRWFPALACLLLAACGSPTGGTDHRVISSREWHDRGWRHDLREVEWAPGGQTAAELHRKASMVNLINLINAGHEAGWGWRDHRRIRVTPRD